MEQEKKDIGEANESNREILEITDDAIWETLVEYGRQCGIKVCLQDLMTDSFFPLAGETKNDSPCTGLTKFLADRFGVATDQIEIALQKDLVIWQRYTVFIGSKGAGVLFQSYDLEKDIIGGQALIPAGDNTLEADDIEE